MWMGKQDEGLGPEGLEGDGVVDFEKRINSLVKRLVTSQRAEDWRRISEQRSAAYPPDERVSEVWESHAQGAIMRTLGLILRDGHFEAHLAKHIRSSADDYR